MTAHHQEIPEMEAGNLSRLEEARKRLANARKILVSIQQVNRDESVLNEHVFHIESVAEKRVETLDQEVASLRYFS